LKTSAVKRLLFPHCRPVNLQEEELFLKTSVHYFHPESPPVEGSLFLNLKPV